MKRKGSRRFIKGLGLALAVAALAAPSAQALRPADENGGLQPSPSRLYADDLHAATPAPVSVQSRLYADDLHAPIPSSPATGQSLLYSDWHAPIPSSPVSVKPDLPQAGNVSMSDSSKFDLNALVIGAGLTLFLLGFGTAILAAREIRRSRPAAV